MRRIAAATELARVVTGEQLKLLKTLRVDQDPLVRAATVRALGKLGDPKTIEPLQDAIADSDSRVTGELGKTLCSFQAYKHWLRRSQLSCDPFSRPIVDEGDAPSRAVRPFSTFSNYGTLAFRERQCFFCSVYLCQRMQQLRE